MRGGLAANAPRGRRRRVVITKLYDGTIVETHDNDPEAEARAHRQEVLDLLDELGLPRLPR